MMFRLWAQDESGLHESRHIFVTLSRVKIKSAIKIIKYTSEISYSSSDPRDKSC